MKKTVSLILVMLMVISAFSTVAFAGDEEFISGARPAPEVVYLPLESNEIFEIVGEADLSEAKPGIYFPRGEYNSRLRTARTPYSSFNYTIPENSRDPKYDGLTAKEVYRITFECNDAVRDLERKGYMGYFASTRDYASFWTSLYYNYGYVQLYVDRKDTLFAGCYNPNTNVIYMYPGIFTEIKDDGTAYILEGKQTMPYTGNDFADKDNYEYTKAYKVKFKSALVSVLYNGKKIAFDQVPVIDGGRTLVPLRGIFETLGATVEWNGETQTVVAKKGDVTISLTLNNKTATKNGENIELDVPAKLIGGRTMVPVRFVADCFGVKVDWDGTTQNVILTDAQ